MKEQSKFISKRLLSIGVGLVLSTSAPVAFASAFQLFEYSAADIGNFNAGGAAIADSAVTAYANPAGLVRLNDPQVAISAIGIWTKGDFSGTTCGGLLCTPTPTSGNGGTYSTVPAFEAAIPLNNRVALGLSATAPFGLSTSWSQNTPLQYSSRESDLQVIDLSPTLGFKITDKFSVGAGLDAQRMNAVLSSDVNFIPGTLNDTLFKNMAQDWAYGWNASALYQFTDATRVGVNYHSQVVHHLDGTSQARGGSLDPLSSHVSTNVTLPSYTMLSGFHAFNPQWSVMATAVYTDWKQVQELVLKNAVIPSGIGVGTTTGTIVIPEGFDSTWRFSAGVDYQMTENWRLRVGGGYDKTPTNTTDRSIRLPDGDHTVVALGAQYRIIPAIVVDAGYEHLFIEDGDINQVSTLAKSIGHTDNNANLFGLQLTLTMV